jgi:hypothetical protein
MSTKNLKLTHFSYISKEANFRVLQLPLIGVLMMLIVETALRQGTYCSFYLFALLDPSNFMKLK